MKLLKIEDSSGYFHTEEGAYSALDKIDKEGLLRLVDWTLRETTVDFDPYDEKLLKNQAHQIIYKSLFRKLQDLRKRKKAFLDESARLFLADYEKYRDDLLK
jgi:hypothetical protein